MQSYRGNSHDITDYKKEADSVKIAFNNEYFHKDSASYGTQSLTDNLLAVYFNLVPEEYKDKVLETIADIITVENNGHLSSGLVGVQWLMRTLQENGMQDIAWQLAINNTYPSWGYMVENGATTIWELFNANIAAPNMNSQNHVMMLGDLIIWYYENLAGIKSSEENPGFKEIIMKPNFVEGLDFVDASYQSVYGKIKSSWRKKDGEIYWQVSIPANTMAKISFPVLDKNNIYLKGKNFHRQEHIKYLKEENKKLVYEIGSGNYEFKILANHEKL